MPLRIYAGWINGAGSEWYALRFGVRLRANSQELLIRMIDLREYGTR